MELIKWSDQYATGIAGIDSEHKELIETINSFYSEMSEDFDRAVLINILNEIYGTIHAHFMLEERLMAKHGYDEYEAHREDHAILLDDIRDITIGLENSSEFDEGQLKTKLSDWFLNHFKTHDSRLHKLQQLMNSHAGTDAGTGFARGLKSLKKLFTNPK